MAKLYFIKLFGCMLLLLGMPSMLQAQRRILPNSEGTAFVQSINVPTNLYTGTASVQIPLCTLETLGGPAINIGLSYQASGIKVEDRETNVGLGWQLTGGGMVTRVIRNRPDESGYNRFGRALDISGTTVNRAGFEVIFGIPSSPYSIGANLLGHNKSDENVIEFDGEPDLYYFQTPTCSGSFVIEYSGEVCLMPYQDIVINIKTDNTGTDYFEIIDTSGIKYRLGSTDNSRESKRYRRIKEGETVTDDWDETYISSWLLEEMIVNNRSAAQYHYQLKTGVSNIESITNTQDTYYYVEAHGGSNNPIAARYEREERDTFILQSQELNSKYLEEITTDYGSIIFVNGNDLVNTISMKKGFGPDYLRAFHLNYGTLNDGRRILNEIQIGYGAHSPTKSLAAFNYHNLYLPTDHKKYVDAYGYYNGPSTISSYASHCGGGPEYWPYDSYDRACKIRYAVHGALRRIIYPTGGYKEFEYESHRFYKYVPVPSGRPSQDDYDDPDMDGYHDNGMDTVITFAGGLRIRKISEYESIGKLANKTEYYYEGAEVENSSGILSSGEPRYIIMINKDNGTARPRAFRYNVFERPVNHSSDFDGTAVVYPKVKEVFSNGGYNIYTFYTPADFPDISWEREICDDGYADSWKEDYNQEDVVIPNTTKFWGRGMPKETIEYTALGNKVSHTKYNYDFSQPSKKVVKAHMLYVGLNDDRRKDAQYEYYIGRYLWISQPIRLQSVETFATDYSLPSRTFFSYGDIYPTLVKYSIQTDAEGKELLTEVKYPFDYTITSPSSSDNQLQALYYMQTRHMINTPIETLTYDGSSYDLISAELSKFRMKGNSVVLDQKMSIRQLYPLWDARSFERSRAGSSFTHSNLYKNEVKYYEYTDKLLPSIFKTGDGSFQAVEYGHDGLYPIATFSNAYTEQDLQNGNRITYRDKLTSTTTLPIFWHGSDVQVSYLKWDNDRWNKHIYTFDTSNIIPSTSVPRITIPATASSPVKDVVIAPKYTTYSSSTLKPGIGKTSEADVNGVSVYYEYDRWGRLKKVFDNDMNILKEIQYGF